MIFPVWILIVLIHYNLETSSNKLKKHSVTKNCWPFTVRINCSSDPKYFENSQLSASNFKSFSWSLEQFFLTVGQNNFGNKIPFLFSFLKAKVLFYKEKQDRCMKFTGLFLVKLTFRLRDLQSFSKQWLLFSSHLSQEHQLHNKVNKVVKFSILETGW